MTRRLPGLSIGPARQSPGCVHWQIMRRTLRRADFDDARHPNSLPLKKARPGQRRHSGPRCLSPDNDGSRWGQNILENDLGRARRTWNGGGAESASQDHSSPSSCVTGLCEWVLLACRVPGAPVQEVLDVAAAVASLAGRRPEEGENAGGCPAADGAGMHLQHPCHLGASQHLRTGVRRRSGWVADRVSRPLAVVTILVLLPRLARADVATVGWGCLAGEDGPP